MQKIKTQNAQNANVKTQSAKEKRNGSAKTVEASNACKIQVLHKKPGVKHGLKSVVHINQCMFCQRLHIFYNIGAIQKTEVVCKCSALISENTQIHFY